MTLEQYLKQNKISVASFSKRLGLRSRASIYKYLKGRKPDDEIMEKIYSFTKGQVTPNDFYNLKINLNVKA